jgi:HK97 family phage portal protein
MGALLGRRNRERRQFAPEPPIPPFPGTDLFGRRTVANTDTALRVPAAWSCISLIANTVSSMQLQTFRQVGDVAQRITDPQIVTNPAANMTQSEWLHMLMVSLLSRGNAYGIEKGHTASFRASQVELVSPDAIRVETDDSGRLVYKLNNGAGGEQDVTAYMKHVRGLTLPGQAVGLSPIEYAARSIGVDLSSRKFAQDFFDGGGVPKATLITDQAVDDEQTKIAKRKFLDASHNREPVVFGYGIKYQPISVRPEESQFLETQQATISDIARYFNVPAEMVGGKAGSSMTYSNVEQRSLDFLTYCVGFWLKRVEDAFSDLLPASQFVKFDTAALLRADAETEARVRAIYVAAKVLPPSRILTEMNEAPLTDDEKVELELVPMGVTAQGSPRVSPSAGAPNVDPGKTVIPVPAPATTPKQGDT